MTIDRRSKYKLDPQRHRSIFENDIVPDLFGRATASPNPRAIVYGGQPGAGKSKSIAAARLEIGGTAAVAIIGDDLRSFHPNYDDLLESNDDTAAFYTDADSAGWVEMAISHAIQQRVGVVIEGTMRNSQKVAETLNAFRGAGYKTDARILAVKHAYSWQGVLERYESQKTERGVGRMTTPEAHQAAYDGMVQTIGLIERDKLSDRLILQRRDGSLIYENALVDGPWKNRRKAVAALNAERQREQTPEEILGLLEGYSRIKEMLARPSRHATQEEVAILEGLKAVAGKMLRQAERKPSIRSRESPRARPNKGQIGD